MSTAREVIESLPIDWPKIGYSKASAADLLLAEFEAAGIVTVPKDTLKRVLPAIGPEAVYAEIFEEIERLSVVLKEPTPQMEPESELQAGVGSLSINAGEDGKFEIWIDHEGTGEEGGTVNLEYLTGVSAEELRRIGDACLRLAASPPREGE